MRVPFDQLIVIIPPILNERDIHGQEKEIIWLLANKYGRIMRSEDISKLINDSRGYCSTPTSIRVQIMNLRRKLEGTRIKLASYLGVGGGTSLEIIDALPSEPIATGQNPPVV